MNKKEKVLTRCQMRKILKTRIGAIRDVALSAGVSHGMVSHFLRGEAKSANVLAHVMQMVKTIQAEAKP